MLSKFSLVVLIISLFACTKDGTISLSNTNDVIGAEISDSTTVKLATYQLDPLPSSGQGVLLVGRMEDAVSGNIAVSSYFRIGNSAVSSASLPDDAVFDSLSLALPYQGYYYGDTTIAQTFTVHSVTEEIKLVDESNAWEDDEKPVFASGSTLFTNSSFSYEQQPLGTVDFHPKPNSKSDTVFVRLNPSFGEDLWTKIKDKSSQVTNSEEFLEYLKGFVLVPSGKASAITAFPTDSILMNLYYSYTRTSDGKRIGAKLQLKVDDNTYQFNKLDIDRSQSLLKALPEGVKGELLASETNQQAVLQGLTGLVAKIHFPYLHEFVNRNDVIINRAELIIETPSSSYIPYTPPASLNIMLADQYGVPKSLLTSSYETTTQTASLVKDLSGGTASGTYTFNLTEYVSNYLGANEDKKSSLYLTIPTADLLTKVDRLLLGKGEGSPAIKLRILYTKY
ncbi:DUF4270 family protein [Olivibacter ginsenosidimutans]|uniref:DUF4270 family protein n=1 Tax=Olivibacter ginsenosidimutans TaxID=1176537 RepID=UPI0031EBD1EF